MEHVIQGKRQRCREIFEGTGSGLAVKSCRQIQHLFLVMAMSRLIQTSLHFVKYHGIPLLSTHVAASSSSISEWSMPNSYYILCYVTLMNLPD